MLLGITLVVTSLIAAETALGFVFDPRYRDFPVRRADDGRGAVLRRLMLLNRPLIGARPIAEVGLCRSADVVRRSISVSTRAEHNWQSLWTCAVYAMLGDYAVAGAGRAKPRISRPIARPDSATL